MPSDNLSLFPATSMSSTPSSQEKPPTAEPTLVRTNTSTATPNDSYHFDFGPLAHVNTAGTIYPAFAGELQPGLWKPQKRRKIANPAPLGLCGFALTTFLLGCINMQTLGIATPNMIVGPALAYGGLVQLLAGMWYVHTFPPGAIQPSNSILPSMSTNQSNQGNGRREHLRRNRTLLLRRLLDLPIHSLHSGRIRHPGRLQSSR